MVKYGCAHYHHTQKGSKGNQILHPTAGSERRKHTRASIKNNTGMQCVREMVVQCANIDEHTIVTHKRVSKETRFYTPQLGQKDRNIVRQDQKHDTEWRSGGEELQKAVISKRLPKWV